MSNNDPLFEALGLFMDQEPSGIRHHEINRVSTWLFDLCHDVLGMNDVRYEVGIQPETHMEMCVFVEDALGDCKFEGDKQKLILIEMPRGSYKTSIIGEGVPIGVTVRNPNARGLMVTHRQDVAKKRLKSVKWHFERNPEFHNRFGDDWKPEFREDVWSDTQITVSKRNLALREPTLDTASVGRDMTGSHYDYIIADDLVHRDNTKTAEQRQEVFEYLMSLLSLLDPGGTLIVIGTRWHVDDAYGKIIKEDERLERQGDKPFFQKYIRSCWDGPDGLFFPKKLTYEFLMSKKAIQGAAFFSANYENKPIADEDRVFDLSKAQIVEFDFYSNGRTGIVQTKHGQYPVDVTMTWDPAGRNPNRKSDYHGITVVGTDVADRWWTLEAEGYKGTPTQVLNRVCNYIAFYQPRLLIVEAVGGYGLWIDLLNGELQRRGLSVAIQEDTTQGQSKQTRILMLEPRWENRRIVIKPKQEMLYNQIRDFSAASEMVHEDVLDALAKHNGHTVVPEETSIQFINPKDPEWEEHKKSLNPEWKNKPGGRHGTNWQT